jgi:protein SCO1
VRCARRAALRVAAGALLAIAIGFAAAPAAAHGDHAPAPAGREFMLDWPVPLGAFMLADTARQAFGPERFRGRWTFVFFGFTHCPDICPAVLDAMAAVRGAVADQAGDGAVPTILFVSVDPERDHPEHLASYVAHFGPDIEGASAPQDHLRRFERYFGASHRVVKRKDPGNYDVMHSGEIYLVDPNARHVATFWPPIDPAAWAKAFLAIRDAVPLTRRGQHR